MDNNLTPISTCTLKMKLLCCDDCPNKLEKKSQKINGVKNVNIDRQQGLVTISSNIDPVILREKIIEMGKRAELWSFEKDQTTPKNKATASSSKTKSCVQIDEDCSCKCHENTAISDEDDDRRTHTNRNNSILAWQRPKQSTKDKKKKKKKVMPMPQPILRPNMNYMGHMSFRGPFRAPYLPCNYGQPTWIHKPPFQAVYGNGYGSCCSYRPRPWAPSYSYYGSGSTSNVNPMIHYTSYEDNYRLR